MAITIRGVVSDTGKFDGGSFVRTYTTVYRVVATAGEGSYEIESAIANSLRIYEGQTTGSLKPLSSVGHPADTQAKVTGIHAERPEADCPENWTCTVDYSTKAADPLRQEASSTDNPIERPPVVRTTTQRNPKPFVKSFAHHDVLGGAGLTPGFLVDGSGHLVLDLDESGNPRTVNVVSSNGEPFNPVPDIDVIDTIITVTRSEAEKPTFARTYIDCVNDRTLLDYLQGEVRMMDVTDDRASEKGFAFYTVTYTLAQRNGGWGVELQNNGSFYFPGGWDADADPIRFTDVAGNTMDVNRLKADGDKLPFGEAPTYTTFYKYPPKNFSLLELEL